MKISAPWAARLRAVGELAGQAELSRRRLAVDLLVLLAAQALLGALDRPVEELARLVGRGGEPVVEGVAQGGVDDAGGLGRTQLVLGLADEFGFAHEDREHGRALDEHVFGGELGGALVAGEFGVVAEAAEQGDAQALFVRAAIGGGDGVAVGLDEAVAEAPGDGPFDGAMGARLADGAREDFVDDARLALDAGGEEVLEAAGEVEARLGRDIGGREALVAGPADFDAAEEVGLRRASS